MEQKDGGRPESCRCYKDCRNCTKDFQKVADLKDLVIYRHVHETTDALIGIQSISKATEDGVFILQNTKDVELTPADYLPELEVETITCERCRKIMEHAQELIKTVPVIDKNAVMAICDHCRLNEQTCTECQEAVKHFFESETTKDNIKDRMKIWLSNVKNSLKDAFIHIESRKEHSRARSELSIDQILRKSAKKVQKVTITDLCGSGYSHRPGLSKTVPLLSMDMENTIDSEPFYAENFADHIDQKSKKQKHVVIRGLPPVPMHSREDIAISRGLSFMDDDRIMESSLALHGTKDNKAFRHTKTRSRSADEVSISQRYYDQDIVPPAQYQHRDEKYFKKELSDEGPIKQKEKKDDDLLTRRVQETSGRGEEVQEEVLEKTTDDFKDSKALKKSHSEDISETAAAKKKDSELLQDFSFTFPQEVVITKKIKRQKDSSELIKDTQDLLRARAEEEEKKRLEEERIRKAEQEEKARLALEAKEKRALEKKKIAEEKERLEQERRKAEEEQRIKNEIERQQREEQKQLEKSQKDEAQMKSVSSTGASKKKKEHKPKSEPIEKPKPTQKEKPKHDSKDKLVSDIKEKAIQEKEKQKPEKEKSNLEEIKDKTTTKSMEKSRIEERKEVPKPESIEKPKLDELKEKPKLDELKEKPKSEREGKPERKKESEEKPKHEEKENIKEQGKPDKEKGGQKQKGEKETLKQKSEDFSKIERDLKQKEKEEKERIKKEQSEQAKQEKEAKQREKEMDQKLKDLENDVDRKKGVKPVETRPRKSSSNKELLKKAQDTPLQKQEDPTTKELNINSITVRNNSQDDLILQLVRLKRDYRDPFLGKRASQIMTPKEIANHKKLHRCHKHVKCAMCVNSDLEFDYDNKQEQLKEIIIGQKILKYKPALTQKAEEEGVVPLLFHSKCTEIPIPEKEPVVINSLEEDKPTLHTSGKQAKGTSVGEQEQNKGVIRYALSDRTFIDKGWTMLPTEKVVRKMNVYRMRPAHPEFDWFAHNKNKRLMQYDSGERLAEFDDNGRGRWYYRNGRLALDYYDAEELNAQQRFVIYSSGEPDERGRSHPYTILATFDYLGNGIVFDHSGKIRLKYNQTEGVVLDRSIGPVSHWKWHTLNDPPVLQQVMIDTQMAHKDPEIIKMGGTNDIKTRPDNEEMLAIEFDNFIKEKSKKLTQSFKPFQIKMKALKINENFSLKVLDQATVYLIFRDGTTNLKLNIGMILDHKEIVDTDTAEVGEVSNNLERFPARTDSLAELQKSVAYAQRFERTRTERERRLRPTEPCGSADKLTAAASRPLRFPLRTVPTGSSTATSARDCYCKSRKPAPNNVYYDNRLF